MPEAGIVGLPNVGKSTLFNALVNNHQAEAANFPFCTIEPNVGIVNLPDERLQRLKDIVNAQKIVPANFRFVDIAGLVKGASEGAGLGNKFLSHIREVDAIINVIRCFEDENVHHVDGSVNSIRDFETIRLELALADLSVIRKRIERLSKQVRSGDKEAQIESEILENIIPLLEEVKTIDLSDEDFEKIRHLNLISIKKSIIAANLKESELASPENNENYRGLKEFISKNFSLIEVLPISAEIEAEMTTLTLDESKEYLESLGVEESGIQSLIKSAFRTLGLMTYFTAGETEARAWTIPVNCKAPQAAGVIHTDFERGFIKAEVVSYEDLVEYGSKVAAKEAGKVRLEGKEYIVKDGDVIEFKFNV
ncbi:MAG: redox-regulated ATPase YchF [Candidatus Caenarcaniphilales bacterium]|nr:redox-regulated ATPase YchF [Candidatus Caenarcaniphilales bacterium]